MQQPPNLVTVFSLCHVKVYGWRGGGILDCRLRVRGAGGGGIIVRFDGGGGGGSGRDGGALRACTSAHVMQSF